MISQILAYVFGGTSIVSIVLFFIFYRQNKLLKQHEVEKSANEVQSGAIANKTSEIQTEMEKISLGDRYLAGIVEATDKISAYQKDYKDGIDSLTENITEIKKDVKSIKTEQKLMVDFLNGEYQDFKKKKTKKE